MRQIEFIAPVAAMRGNLSGKQTLLYPTRDNSAWEAPANKRSYARNYKSRFIGNKRSGDGKIYFSVKSKSAVFGSNLSRLNQALLAGSRVCADAALANLSFRQSLTMWAVEYRQTGVSPQQPAFQSSDFKHEAITDSSLRTYLMRCFRQMLELQMTAFTFQSQLVNYTFNNPWNPGSASGAIDLSISGSNFIKFFAQFTPDGGYYYVNGAQSIAYDGASFDSLVNSQKYNILGLTIDASNYVKYGNYFLQSPTDPTAAVNKDDDVVLDHNYKLRRSGSE